MRVIPSAVVAGGDFPAVEEVFPAAGGVFRVVAAGVFRAAGVSGVFPVAAPGVFPAVVHEVLLDFRGPG